ncbi:MAG: hypothetical protein ACRDQD_07825 [Nocardioidaceae bacterium]
MGTRHEKVVLSIDDGLTPGLGRAAGAAALLDTNLERLDGTAIGAGRSMRSANQSVEAFGTSTRRSAPDLNKYTGRLSALATAAFTLGPALIPLGASAVPVVTTLAAGMGAAAGAATVLALAFAGVGEAVEAVSEYKLAPTAENLAKVQEAMDKLGPSGAQFVLTLDEMAPALEELQRTAGEGVFPGFDRGLRELRTELPGVRALVADLSSTVGELGEASADALVNDADWQEFFDHIGTDGASTLDSFGRATGNFVAGVANILEALSGISGSRADLVENARAFREWAADLEHTEGFQEFADAVRESGPQVAEFLGATGKAMVALIQAAAPWGNVVLPALTTAAELFAVIAGSPIGPPLFTAAAAMLAFSKASALVGPRLTQASTAMVGARTSVKQLSSDLKTVTGGWVLASSATQREAAVMGAATDRLKGNLASIGKGAAIVGSAGLLASGAADKMGVTNAVMLGMAGSLAGPWGAAAGAAVGLTLDLAHANDDLKASVDAANAAMSAGGLAEMGAAVKQLRADLQETGDADIWGLDLGDGFGGRIAEISNVIAPLTNVKKLMGGLTGESDKAAKKLEELKAAKAGMEGLAVALGANKDSATEMSSGVDRAQFAMERLGISSKDVAKAQQEGGSAWLILQARIRDYVAFSDSAEGRTEAVGDALENMGKDAMSAAESAAQLSAAMSALITPQQDLIASQDQMTTSLRTLGDDLAKQSNTLVGNTDAAIKNRAAISDRVTALLQLHEAEAAAGKDPLELAVSLDKQRQAMVEAGTAAGLNKRELEGLLTTYGLTPDLVRTEFEAAGIPGVTAEVQGLAARYKRLPPKLQTEIATNGIPQSEAEITRLKKKYDLTPKQVQTLARLKDNASGPIAAVIAALRAADGKSATTTITTRRITEIQTISIGQQTRTDRRIEPQAIGGFHVNGVRAFADGGYGLDGRYYSRKPQLVAGGANVLWGEKETGWEAYISGKPSERDRNLEILALAANRLGASVMPAAAGRITAYANGGTSTATGFGKARRTDDGWGYVAKALGKHEKALERHGRRIERAIDKQEKAIDRAEDRLEAWNQRRDDIRQAVTGSLTRDWMGSNSSTNAFAAANAPGTAAYAQSQWKQQSSDADKLARTIANLRKNGAGDAFIAEILNSPDPLAAASMFNKQTKAGMRHSQKLFLDATRSTQSAANSTSSIYADEQRKATAVLHGLRGDLRRLEKQLSKNHKEREATSKKHSGASAAAKGRRDSR